MASVQCPESHPAPISQTMINQTLTKNIAYYQCSVDAEKKIERVIVLLIVLLAYPESIFLTGPLHKGTDTDNVSLHNVSVTAPCLIQHVDSE